MKPEGVYLPENANTVSHNVDVVNAEHDSVYVRRVELKSYELTDHLGNVRVVINDVKTTTEVDGDGKPQGPYTSTLLAANNYYPFGMLQPGRHWSTNEYRYGYNGKEMDHEAKGEGNSYDFGARIYDPRIGNWLSLDPLQRKYPGVSPYNAFGANPILFNDPDGREVRNAANDEDEKARVKALIDIADPEMIKFLNNLQLNDKLRYVSPEDGSKVALGLPVFIDISVDDIDEKKEDYDKDYKQPLLKRKMRGGRTMVSHNDMNAGTYFNFDWDREVMSTEGININGEFKSWESFDSDESAIEAIKTYGEANSPITFTVSAPIRIVLDDAPTPHQDERINLAHELGGIIEQINNLPAALYYSRFKKNKNGTRGDSENEHEFEKNPHAVGAEKAEKKERERINNGE